MVIKIGDAAPAFSLISDAEKKVSASDFAGKKWLLYFYPKDNTPGCTQEACDFRDAMAQFQQLQIPVIGISKDTPQQHRKFKEKYQLPFILLSDPTAEVCMAYDVIKPKSLFGKSFLGINRSTFLIDEQGKIAHIWRKVKVSGHVKEILVTVEED